MEEWNSEIITPIYSSYGQGTGMWSVIESFSSWCHSLRTHKIIAFMGKLHQLHSR